MANTDLLIKSVLNGPRVPSTLLGMPMGRSCCAFVVAGCLLLAAWPAAADCTFAIKRSAGEAGTVSVGSVSLWPFGIAPEQAAVEVTGPSGTVGSRILWARAGDPLSVLFDASEGAESYTVRIAATGVAASDWAPHAGVVLETRARKDGPAETLGQVQNLWRHAADVLGRSLVPAIFDGVHRHGPTTDFVSHYTGWFQAPKDGSYAFATVSTDASFLLIDGRTVASWPGWHGVDGGRRAQHSGTIDLHRGSHAIEYWNVTRGGEFQISAAWRPPGADGFIVMPPKAFVPIASFTVDGVRGDQAAAAFSWEVQRHAQAGDALLVGMRFRALGASAKATCHWRFDDGTEAEGTDCLHAFSRAGLRRVDLTVQAPGHPGETLTQLVGVHPNWAQIAECAEPVYAELRAEVLGQGLDRLAPTDLAEDLRMAERMEDGSFMGALADAVCLRLSAFTGPLAVVPHRIGFYAQRPGVMQYARVPVVWRAVIADASAALDLRARTAVHLAGFLIHSATDPAGGLRLLDEAAPDKRLTDDERRLKTIFRADGLVLTGQREAALACYRQAGAAVSRGDTDYEVRRRGRIETARDEVRRHEYDAAEEVVRGLEWEWPLERLDLESGLLMVEIYRGRGENLMALGVCKRLLMAAPADPRRPDLLLATARVCRDLKQERECRATLAQLLKEHPYSEAAALAKDAFAAELAHPSTP